MGECCAGCIKNCITTGVFVTVFSSNSIFAIVISWSHKVLSLKQSVKNYCTVMPSKISIV